MSKLAEVKKASRLYALYDAKMDKIGDIKYIKVYEIIKFRIKQKNRYITKKYYNLIYKNSYSFISYIDDVNRYNKLYNYYSKMSPFIIEVEIMTSNDIEPLKQYYIDNNKKYFDIITSDDRYNRKKIELLEVKKHIKIDLLDKFNNIIYFEL